MNIAVIGRGSFGTALAESLSRAGHNVCFGMRKPAPGSSIVNAESVADAISNADIVFATFPHMSFGDAVSSWPPLGDRIVVDCTNPFVFSERGIMLQPQAGQSHGEVLRRHHPDARYLKSFNQVGANVITATPMSGVFPLMFAASDHADAKSIVSALSTELGFDARDAGPEDNAPMLEAFGALWVGQAMSGPQGRDFGFTVTHIKPDSTS